jgi:translation initiation factor IF-1
MGAVPPVSQRGLGPAPLAGKMLHLAFWRGLAHGAASFHQERTLHDHQPADDSLMPKEEVIRIEGEITEILPDGRFRVKLENEHEIIAYTAGKMRKNRIRSIVGDRVHVEMTPYDLDKGRIVFREKTAPMPMNQRRFFRR